jgi:predicted dienelactone hydrolase
MHAFLLVICIAFTLLCANASRAAVGLMEVGAPGDPAPVTVFYPSSDDVKRIARGPFVLDVAWQGVPVRGNGQLIVISHGSPASPWVHADLARTLVETGFVVAIPEHFADNYKNSSEPGPASWKRRPAEVSHAIDVIARNPQLGALVSVDKVGMFGMSAGGHTALTLAGGRWSPAQLKQHCETFVAEDFQACAGLVTRLDGGFLDRLKIHLTRWVSGIKLNDSTWYGHTDPRIAAIVAGVPFAADFDLGSLAAPPLALGIVSAAKDKWLNPRFHSERILQACTTCERVADLANGGHGALLSPLPPERSALLAELIDDPSGFDRATMVPEVNRKIAAFFVRHLVAPKTMALPTASSLQSAVPRSPS